MKTTHKSMSTSVSRQVLAWYARHERDLPWRKTRNPYHIWVSEVMLQQTRVDTVIPYYHRFLSRFPTVEALASASVDDVLKVWENMGYYARARNLHGAAREIVGKFNGRIPDTWQGLTGLPGIGSYTAGAVLSMAYGQPVPAVDGNVKRILARLFAIHQPLDQTQAQKRVMDLVRDLLPEKDPGRFNQALMDLGSNICTPRKPKCPECPVRSFCEAYQHDLQGVLPVIRKRGPLPHTHVTAGIIRDPKGRVLIVKRPAEGLLGGLWKFPGGPQVPDASLKSSLRRRIVEELGIRVKVGKSIASVRHAYTHFRITLHAFGCTRENGKPRALGCHEWRWVPRARLQDYAFSKADRQIMKTLLLDN